MSKKVLILLASIDDEIIIRWKVIIMTITTLIMNNETFKR